MFLTILAGSFGIYFAGFHALWTEEVSGPAARRSPSTSPALDSANAEHMDIVTAFSLFPWIFWAIQRSIGPRKSGGPDPCSAWRWGCWSSAAIQVWCCSVPSVVRQDGPSWLLVDLLRRPGLVARRSWCEWASSLALGRGNFLRLSACHRQQTSATFSRGEPSLRLTRRWIQGLVPSGGGFLAPACSGTPFDRAPRTAGAAADISMRGLYFGNRRAGPGVLCRAGQPKASSVTVPEYRLSGVALLDEHGGGIYFFTRGIARILLSFQPPPGFPAADSRAVAALVGCLLAGGGLANFARSPL